MERKEYPIDAIPFDDKGFGEHAVDSLLTNRAFRVVDLPEQFMDAIKTLMKRGHNFFDGVNEEVAKEYTTEVESFMGLVRSNKFPSICNALRFFTKVNTNGEVENSIMPDDKDEKQMRNSVETVNKFLRDIVEPITVAIEKKFAFKKDSLTTALGHSVINSTRYTPVTQDVIKAMFKNKSLVVTDDGEAMLQFLPHGDLSMFTALIYSHSTGLEIRSDVDYQPVDVQYDKHGIIILTGSELELLTSGELKPAVHRVKCTPQMAHDEVKRASDGWRYSLSCHVFYNAALKKCIGPLDGSKDSVPWDKFFKQYQESMYKDEEVRTNKLPKEFLDKFPVEVDDKEHYLNQFNFGYMEGVNIKL